MKQVILPWLAALLLSGCEIQLLRPLPVVIQNPEALGRTLGDRVPQQTAIQAVITEMAGQLESGLRKQGIKRLPITITRFVDLAAPNDYRPLDSELAEGFYYELQSRGFNLIDQMAIAYPSDQTPLDELKLSDIYREHGISYVLSGTYSVRPDGLGVSVRILDSVTRQVVASGRSQLAAEVLEGRIPGYNPLSSEDGMIIENGGVPSH